MALGQVEAPKGVSIENGKVTWEFDPVPGALGYLWGEPSLLGDGHSGVSLFVTPPGQPTLNSEWIYTNWKPTGVISPELAENGKVQVSLNFGEFRVPVRIEVVAFDHGPQLTNTSSPDYGKLTQNFIRSVARSPFSDVADLSTGQFMPQTDSP